MNKFTSTILHIFVSVLSLVMFIVCLAIEESTIIGYHRYYAYVYEITAGIEIIIFSALMFVLSILYQFPFIRKSNFKLRKLLGGLFYSISSVLIIIYSIILLFYDEAFFTDVPSICIVNSCLIIILTMFLWFAKNKNAVKKETVVNDNQFVPNNVNDNENENSDIAISEEICNELYRIKKLYDEGIITEEEYNYIREKILLKINVL